MFELIIPVNGPVPGIGGGNVGEALGPGVFGMDQNILQAISLSATQIDLAYGVTLAITPVMASRRGRARGGCQENPDKLG